MIKNKKPIVKKNYYLTLLINTKLTFLAAFIKIKGLPIWGAEFKQRNT